MLFASLDFLLFFLPVLAAYWFLGARPWARATLLIAASYFFYMAGPRPSATLLPTPWYTVGLLVVSTLLDYAAALQIQRARQRNPAHPGAGRFWLLLSLSGNLGLLAYFKYVGFGAEVAQAMLQTLGFDVSLPPLRKLLPVGISFYTFQSLSYTLDVWRRRMEPEPSLRRFAVFVCFFPQLVAGPIVRAVDFLPQLHARLKLEVADVNFALWRIGKGLVKKVLLGDFVAAQFADPVFAAPTQYSSLENLFALYAFTLQIYADFSGYSDIAIGTARLLGFKLPENFDRPYQAASVGEFWRRWHITLSTWLRDYLFFPLGGSRKGPVRTYFNLWLTMFLVGMWHGASWNFVVYSNLQGAALLLSRYHERRSGGWVSQLGGSIGLSLCVAGAAWLAGSWWLAPDESWWGTAIVCGVGAMIIGWLPSPERARWLRPVHVFATLHFCVLSRVFFRATDLPTAKAMLSQLIAWDGHGFRPGLFSAEHLMGSAVGWVPEVVTHWAVLLVILAGFLLHYLPPRWFEVGGLRWFARAPGLVVGAAMAIAFALLSQLLTGPRANIYFSF